MSAAMPARREATSLRIASNFGRSFWPSRVAMIVTIALSVSRCNDSMSWW
jgi:hypothetical protein